MSNYVAKSRRKGNTMIVKERTDWENIAGEYEHAPGTMDSFYLHLCKAIANADLADTERLRKAYPELVALIKGER